MNNPSPNKDYTAKFSAAIYFAVFILIFNLIAKYFLFVFQAGTLLPIFSSSVLAIIVGFIFGWLYGNKLPQAKTTWRAFGWGALCALSMIPFYSAGLEIIDYFHNPSTYARFHFWQDYLILYGVYVIAFFLILGIWLILISGLVAIHFNRKFFPGFSNFIIKEKNKNNEKHL